MCPVVKLNKLEEHMQDCRNCLLSKSRKNVVFGSGDPNAAILFVGEAPGENEDVSGLPFVGRSGKRLEDAIGRIGLTREDVYICNILKCRPPGNRNPLPAEIAACQPVLVKQLEIIMPKVIVALGKFAAQTLLKTRAEISELRGLFFDYHGVPLIPTWHPAYTLYNNSKKTEFFSDIQAADEMLCRKSKG